MPVDDTKTTAALFKASLEGDYDDQAAWDAVSSLRRRNTDDVFQAAVQFVESAEPLKRRRGLDVLAQIGSGRPMAERPHFIESVAIATQHLHDADSSVVHSAAWALAHLGDDAAVSALIPMHSHPDPHVRWAVANGLNGTERSDGIATIITLMNDPDDNVRDWATFALGTQCDVDSIAIREALRMRLTDSDGDTRDEALWGLARRKDSEAIRLLIQRLSRDEWIAGDEVAATEVLNLPQDTPVEDLRQGLTKLIGG